MTRRWLAVTGLWVLIYPVPPLPFAPAFGYLTAVLLGPPYTDGTSAHGWPRIGEVTPSFVAVTVGVPWLATSVVVATLGVVMSRREHSSDGGRTDAP